MQHLFFREDKGKISRFKHASYHQSIAVLLSLYLFSYLYLSRSNLQDRGQVSQGGILQHVHVPGVRKSGLYYHHLLPVSQ